MPRLMTPVMVWTTSKKSRMPERGMSRTWRATGEEVMAQEARGGQPLRAAAGASRSQRVAGDGAVSCRRRLRRVGWMQGCLGAVVAREV